MQDDIHSCGYFCERPQCGGELDIGWECNDCGYDARDEAYPAARRERDKALAK